MRVGVGLELAGFVATAVAYGPARMGFGMFLPELRADLEISSSTAGLIGSAAFVAFLAAIPAAAWLTSRYGIRFPVVLGLICASVGTACVAAAHGAPVLAIGVVLAGTSPGLCWSPFSDGAAALLPAGRRPRVLSIVSTGTTIGIAGSAAAGLLTVLGGLSWRCSWVMFALAAFGSAAVAARLLPGGNLSDVGESRPSASHTTRARLTALLSGLGWPLLAAASFGAISSVYLVFAVDAVASAGGLTGLSSAAAGKVIYLFFGVCGLMGLFAGEIERRLGLVGFLSGIFAASAVSMVLIGRFPNGLVPVLVSAALMGVAVMTMSAVLSFWTTEIRPGDASRAFAVVISGIAVGSVVAPAAAGAVLDEAGHGIVFGVASAISLATAGLLVLARARVRARP